MNNEDKEKSKKKANNKIWISTFDQKFVGNLKISRKIIKAIITLLIWEIIKEKLPSVNGRETEETITMPNRVRKNTEKIMPQSKSFKS